MFLCKRASGATLTKSSCSFPFENFSLLLKPWPIKHSHTFSHFASFRALIFSILFAHSLQLSLLFPAGRIVPQARFLAIVVAFAARHSRSSPRHFSKLTPPFHPKLPFRRPSIAEEEASFLPLSPMFRGRNSPKSPCFYMLSSLFPPEYLAQALRSFLPRFHLFPRRYLQKINAIAPF